MLDIIIILTGYFYEILFTYKIFILSLFKNNIFTKEYFVCHGKKANKRPMGQKVILIKFSYIYKGD